MNALSQYVLEQAAAQRANAAEQPDDERYERSAAALEALAEYAEAGVQRGMFQMRYLLEHHVVGGRFAWGDGQCGRSIRHFGFDRPVRDEADLDGFLMDLCDLAKSDATRHIGEHEERFDRADAEAIARRFGIEVERVHHALDTGRRYAALYIVGIPAWHEPGSAARERLEALDGVIVAPGTKEEYGDTPPLLVKNVPAAGEREAREQIAQIVGIDAGALGVTASPRVW